MGMLKRRIYPQDITINIGEGEEIPEHPYPGQKWKEVYSSLNCGGAEIERSNSCGGEAERSRNNLNDTECDSYIGTYCQTSEYCVYVCKVNTIESRV